VLAVCGGGGNDLVAWLIVLGVLLGWIGGAVLIVKSARNHRERHLLIGLLIASVLLGPLLVAAFYDGVFGADGSYGKLAGVLLIPGAIGTLIALKTRDGHGVRAFLISTWGAFFLSGLWVVIFIAFIAVGTGCIDD
jgi:hypothetical protein